MLDYKNYYKCVLCLLVSMHIFVSVYECLCAFLCWHSWVHRFKARENNFIFDHCKNNEKITRETTSLCSLRFADVMNYLPSNFFVENKISSVFIIHTHTIKCTDLFIQ